MSDPINITAIYDINTGRDRIEITGAIAADIVRRGLEHSRHGLPITPQTITMPPTKPPANQCQGDDAAIDKMADLIQSCDAGDGNNRVQVGSHDECYVLGRYTSRRIAPQIIAAIRRGEVPGVTTSDLHLEKWKEAAELRNDADVLRGTVKATVAERDDLRAKLADAENGRKQWKADEGKAAGERDKALADLAVLQCAFKASLAREHAIGVTLRRFEDALHNAQSERNAARAEVAALKARKVKLPPSFTVTNFCQPCLGEYDVHSSIRAAGVEVA